MMNNRIVVIGGGASGMAAALSAAGAGAAVTLLERNEKTGRKLYITGKGRCNILNNCGVTEFLSNVPRNGRFLYSAITRFPPDETISFFESLGLPLKTERGNRVFPASDRSADVIDTLMRALRRAGVSFLRDRAVRIITEDGAVVAVEAEGRPIACRAVILATGGLSYPATGSTGDGHRMAAELGHTVVPAVPSLVPLTAAGRDCERLMGLSLKNVTLRVVDFNRKLVFTELGELLFTHFGLSGPLVLSASAHMRNMAKTHYYAEIDLKPGLSEEVLDKRLLRDFAEFSNRQFENALEKLLPSKLIPIIVERSGIPPDTRVHSITKVQREALLHQLKSLTFSITGTLPIEEAVITSGGVATAEISPGTMESRLVKGLYFAGELIDVDAYTGGFNLQIAWSTGRVAGLSAAIE